MFMDVSSEMIHSLLPVFMVTSLGVSVVLVGFLDGLAEATALVIKIFSGAISDYFGKRKWLAAFGYGLSAITKPLFALATSFDQIFFARMADRVGKGMRGAPRDALIADITPPELRGAAYGLRQGLDTIGAFAGPLLAFAIMSASNDDFQLVFWTAVIPALLAVSTMSIGVKEPARKQGEQRRANPITRANLVRLGRPFWWTVAIGGLIMFARVGDAFLVLRATEASVPIAAIPLVLVAMNALYSATAYPFGKLADRLSVTRLLGFGIGLLVLADLALAMDTVPGASLLGLVIGLAFWGLHLAATQGLLAAMVAKAAPTDLRGTAFGVYNLVSGLALFVSGVATGLVWQGIGFQFAFIASAVVALAALGLVLLKRRTW